MESSQPDATLSHDPAHVAAASGEQRSPALPSPVATDVAARRSLPMALLAAGVPLSLLIDLVPPNGPDSAGIAAAEQGVTA